MSDITIRPDQRSPSGAQEIDILNDDLIDLRQACREKPFRNGRTGKPAHVASMYRHVLHGARAANGERIKLETIRTPSGLRTSREAIQRFIAALTDPAARVTTPTPKLRRKQIDAAEKELMAAGFDVGGPENT